MMRGEKRFTVMGNVNGVESITFSPDGKNLAAALKDGRIFLWRAGTREDSPAETADGHGASPTTSEANTP